MITTINQLYGFMTWNALLITSLVALIGACAAYKERRIDAVLFHCGLFISACGWAIHILARRVYQANAFEMMFVAIICAWIMSEMYKRIRK